MTTGDGHLRYDAATERRAFFEGIRLFNEGSFFEAHDTWEEAWNMAVGRKARFYQGLIQTAVTLEHINRDNPRGVKKVWTSTLRKFDGFPEVVMGINIQSLLAGLHPVIDPILGMATRQGQQPGEVSLPWNREAVPKISLLYDPFETGEAERMT